MAAAPAIVELTGGTPPTDPQFWLDAATQAVRSYCGWHVSPAVEEVLTLTAGTGYHGRRALFLPSLRINEIVEVLNDGEDVTADVEMDKEGYLILPCGWSYHLSGVQITLNHGFPLDEVADLAGIISRLAQRAAASASNIVAQRAGSMSVQYGVAGGLPVGTDLLQAEKDALARYKVVTH